MTATNKKATKTKQSTRHKQEWIAAQDAAEHLALMMENGDLPAIVHDTICDFVLELSNQTRVDLLTPNVLRAALPIMLAQARSIGLRVNAGAWSNEARAKGTDE